MGVVITLVVGLAIAVIVAVARDPGPTPDDVAIGYARALAAGDFDAVYRLIDPDLLHGRNRPSWVADQASRPRLAFSPDSVTATGCVHGDDVATVTLSVDAGRSVPVELVFRQRVWVVARFDGVKAATAR